MPSTKGLYDSLKEKVFAMEMNVSSAAILSNTLTRLQIISGHVHTAPLGDINGQSVMDTFQQAGAKIAEWCGLVTKTTADKKETPPLNEKLSDIAKIAWKIFAHMDTVDGLPKFQNAAREDLDAKAVADISLGQKLLQDLLVHDGCRKLHL